MSGGAWRPQRIELAARQLNAAGVDPEVLLREQWPGALPADDGDAATVFWDWLGERNEHLELAMKQMFDWYPKCWTMTLHK